MAAERRKLPGLLLLAVLALALPLLVLESVRQGRTGVLEEPRLLEGVLAAFELGEPLEMHRQAIIELRLWRALLAAGVGAGLALSGSLLQGVFRNALAAPSILGLTSGASLGAALAVLSYGGYGPVMLTQGLAGLGLWVMGGAAFGGALLAVVLVMMLAAARDGFSVPSLLLTGIAVNACLGGILAAIQSFSLQDYELVQAMLAWAFGNLDDRGPAHAALAWVGVALAGLCAPFVARELDLLQGGENDARSLGVSVRPVRFLAVAAAALCAASAIAMAGQIAFVGLVVPHILRLLGARRHAVLLPASILGGAVFLLGVELLQMVWLAESALRPGVLMSLFGGPFFLVLLLTTRGAVRRW